MHRDGRQATIVSTIVLTAPTWTYSAAGGPNPFIVPARGGFIATAINTESGATIVGLGRRQTRFVKPLKLEPRGVAIFAQPAPNTLPEHAWAIGYSTTSGVTPRLIGISREGEIAFDVARAELSWRDGRSVSVTETSHGPVLHIDDRHLILDTRGDVVADVARPGTDAPYVIDGRLLFAFDGSAVVCVDLVSGAVKSRIPVDGKPGALRVDAFEKRLAIRIDRVLCTVELDDAAALPRLRAFVGNLSVSPHATDSNIRAVSGPPAVIECIDDDGVPRWNCPVPGASSAQAMGFFIGGEALITSSTAAQNNVGKVLVIRDGETIFERPRAGQPLVCGALARVGERAAIVIAPGVAPSGLIEFSTNIELTAVRGGGAVAFERPSPGGTHRQRMIAVDPAGAMVVEVVDGGGGARWAAASDGLIAVPRTNSARVDLYDIGAPA